MSEGYTQEADSYQIRIETMVGSRTGEPSVVLKWAKEEGYLTPAQARAHAQSIMEAATAAEFDGCLVRFARENLAMPDCEVVDMLRTYRQRRDADTIHPMPASNIHLPNGEILRPDMARDRAYSLMRAAFSAEAESFLSAFLMRESRLSAKDADWLVQKFREMRGAVTVWPDQSDQPAEG